MTFNFTPIEAQSDFTNVPYIEDARADFAPYYASTKTPERAKKEVLEVLAMLHATGFFTEGDFQVGKHKRRGYVLQFNAGGALGRMTVAGLPIHYFTQKKLDQVRTQALLNLKDWLRNAVTSQVFTPGSNPLIPFMLVDGQRTLLEAILEDRRLPLLGVPAVKVEVVE